MGHRTLRLISVFLALLWIPSGAEAITRGGMVWWGGAGGPVKQPVRNIPTTHQVIPGITGNTQAAEAIPLAEGIPTIPVEIVSVIGSEATYEGRVVNFETRYDSSSPNADICAASVVVEDAGTGTGPRAFRANVSANPQYFYFERRYQEPKFTYIVDTYPFRLNLLCRQLQSAFLNNQKVRVVGVVESTGNADQNTLGSLRVVSALTTPTGDPSNSDLSVASVCLDGIDCVVEGIPIQFVGDTTNIDGYFYSCQAVLKINTGGVAQKISVSVPSKQIRGEWGPVERKSLQTLDSMCETLLEAMGSQKMIGVVGRVGGGILVSSRILNPGPFTLDMDPVF